MEEELQKLRDEMQEECAAILEYWMRYTPDHEHGGFYGRIDNGNNIDKEAPKGSVLHSRILWTFSAAYTSLKESPYLDVATRAFEYVATHFIDHDYGGVYWTIDYQGKPLDTKKQVYANAFALYGFAEYFKATADPRAKVLAFNLYKTMERYSHDKQRGGYLEAFDRHWNDVADLRLSTKDYNEKKSMNTHLHVLEAYANVYSVWPDESVRNNIIELLKIFLQYIIDPLTNHLILFFDEDWNQRSGIISYGHDIEAAWLLLEAAEIIGDEALINMLKLRSVKLVKAAARGLDKDGGLWYEKDIAANHLVKQKHWWPQAEAVVGFYNAWQLTSDDQFLEKVFGSWQFIKQHLLNKTLGEWYWGIDENGAVMQVEDKVGLWKCPYHNGRACLEMIKRIPQ